MEQLLPGEYDAVLNGIRIHYSIQGTGPVILAHSGGPGIDARTWGDFAGIHEFLTVVAIHPRGSGLSDYSADRAYRLPDYASDLEALRLHLGLEQPVVMGWSHGGMVAQQFASTYPASLSKLILFDTSAYFGEFLQDIRGAVEAYRDQPWFAASYAALEKEWAGEYETDEEMTRLWAEEIKFYFKNYDARAADYTASAQVYPLRIESLQTFNEHEALAMDLRPLLGKIAVPTLVISGRHDFITTIGMAEEMVRHIPAARLEVFEESGHFALVEEPEKFRQVVGDFVLRGV